MQKIIILMVLLFSINGFAQSPKSVETIQDERLEEQRIRQAWDRQEEEAQAQQEKQRQIDEERAEGYEPQRERVKVIIEE